MKIWVDADACPVVIKEIIFKASNRTGIHVIFIANQNIPIPDSKTIKMIRVPSGFDRADNEIINRMEPGDLIVTSDIPLAADAIKNHGVVLTPRGEKFTKDNIGPRLNMRDFMETLRASGQTIEGPSAFSKNDRKLFADNLDKILVKELRNA